MGKVVDSQRSQEFADTLDYPGRVLPNGARISNDSKWAVYRTQQTFVIQTDTHEYTVSELLRGKPDDVINYVSFNGELNRAVDRQESLGTDVGAGSV
jgi:hypothetical protein